MGGGRIYSPEAQKWHPWLARLTWWGRKSQGLTTEVLGDFFFSQSPTSWGPVLPWSATQIPPPYFHGRGW